MMSLMISSPGIPSSGCVIASVGRIGGALTLHERDADDILQ